LSFEGIIFVKEEHCKSIKVNKYYDILSHIRVVNIVPISI